MLLLTRDGLYKCVCEAIVRPEVMFSVGVNSVEVECQYLCLVKPRMIYFINKLCLSFAVRKVSESH